VMTASVLLTGTVPAIAQNFSNFDVSEWPKGALVSLGLVFTAISGLDWWRDANRKAAVPVSAKMSGGDGLSIHGF
jgi:hypothetical protein